MTEQEPLVLERLPLQRQALYLLVLVLWQSDSRHVRKDLLAEIFCDDDCLLLAGPAHASGQKQASGAHDPLVAYQVTLVEFFAPGHTRPGAKIDD